MLSVRIICSPTSIDYIYTTKRVLHLQICDEASPKISLKIGPLYLYSYGYRKCMFVDSLPENIGPPNCVMYRLWSS